MTGNELRDAFLRFFEEKGHKVLPSYPLVLPEDPSTLFTVAGMQPFSPVFRGEVPAPAPRVATSQKVFREGDLDAVGRVGRYHTFYEMLGNFSFGDYFKREAVEYGWEFVTQVMKLPPEKLWVTIYEEDEETAGYWQVAAKLPPERIVRLGKKDNWWPQVAWDGPCGPCSEIYLDRGEAWGCGEPDCKPGCDCDRFLEFWNLVFQMYIQDASGVIRGNLPHPGIDTGMGLERAACLVMDVPSNYETDLVLPVIQQLVQVLREDESRDIHYTPFRTPTDEEESEPFSDADEGESARLRSIADHIRAASFLIADNVRPGPDGRGSVLRRLIRRSFGHGWRLGVRDPFLYRCVPGVVRALGAAYPEIVQRQEYIENTIRSEEELFRTTVEAGMHLLQRVLDERCKAGLDTVEGTMAFRLATTHGFPLELTRDVASQYGFTVEQESYDRAMEEFRRQSKDPDKDARGQFTAGLSQVRKEHGATRFTGYTELMGTAVVLALLSGREDRDRLQTGEDGVVTLDSTPFYAESGGQLGDTGTVLWPGGRAAVRNTTKLNDLWLHHVLIEEGELRTGDSVSLQVDATRRSLTQRNHTATHLMHAALHQFLGAHATQAGSLVAPDRLRFDFSHSEPINGRLLQQIEQQVQEWIDLDLPVNTEEHGLEEARQLGAMALFGEKYGDRVRVVEVGAEPISLELCGGTHVRSTGVIGPFHITSESGVGAGLRRIEAVTGPGALQFYREREDALRRTADQLRCNVEEVPDRVGRLQQQVRDLQKQRDDLLVRGAGPSEALDGARMVRDIPVVTVRHDGLDGDALGKVADQAISKLKSGVIVLVSVADGKVLFVSKVSSDAVKRGIHAGNLVKALATQAGGGGGGRPDFAQAGGRNPAAVDGALESVAGLVEGMLKS